MHNVASSGTQARLGPYLLLKKLSEDPLGETFRAGQVSDQGIEQVLLLRVLNGSAVRHLDLGERIQELAGLHEVLRSPNLAKGVDGGHYQGVSYVAYDYISGEDLATLMLLARRRHHPMPAQHALLVAERLASGLSVAYATRFHQQPVVHGFLVPQLVRLSSEGENRLMGFEVGNALRSLGLDKALIENYGAYLSPEARAGKPPSATDDVYSLGVILLELLAGSGDDDVAARRKALEKIVAQGMPEIAGLIQKSLGRVEDRIADVPSWQRAFQQIVGQGSSRSTPFHLAFYMHNVLRDEIEREDQEIEHERSMELSKEELAEWLDPDTPSPPLPTVQTAAAGVATASEEPTEELEAVVIEEGSGSAAVVAASATSGRRARWPAAVLVLFALALVAGGVYWKWFLRPADGLGTLAAQDSGASGFEPANQPSAPAPPVFPSPAGLEGDQLAAGESGEPSDAEDAEGSDPELDSDALLARIDEIVDERTRSVEDSLRRQYDEELKRLRDQLAQTEAAREEEQRLAEEEAERLRRLADSASRQSPQLPDDTPSQPSDQASTSQGGAPAAGRPTSSDRATRTAADLLPATSQPSTTPTASASSSVDAKTPRTGIALSQSVDPPLRQPAAPDRAASERAASERAAAQQPATSPKTTQEAGDRRPTSADRAGVTNQPPASPRSPAAAQVKLLPPRLKKPPEARYPTLARRLGREAVVEVEVLVNAEGKVLEAKSRTKVSFGFAEAAERAARGARFYPATRDGMPVEARTTIRISFKNDGG